MNTQENILIPTNEFQTKITKELLDQYPDEVQEQFLDFFGTVPMLKWMIGERPRAKDLPRDSNGRIIVDITHPHILEDMDYFRPAIKFFQENGCFTFLKPNKNPNSEYGKWFTEEVRRCREGYVRESDGEWVTGHMYFFLNYSPIMIAETDADGVDHRFEGFPLMWEGIYYRFHYLYQARRNKKHGLELAKRGCGKAHPYIEKVITPDGEKLWGDISIGDKLFGDDGKVTTVIDIPFDDVCDTYRITLKDGRQILASDEHLWRVLIHNHKNEEILSTKQIIETYKRKRKVTERNPRGVEYVCGIPANEAIDFEYYKTAIEPYTFGVLLGAGCFRAPCCYVSLNDNDAESILANIPYEWKRWKSDCAYVIKIPNWHNILKSYGLDMVKSEGKFIPDEYKHNSKEVRLALLRGLIDTDGFIEKHKSYQYSTASRQLADDIRWLCWSLGYNTTVVKKKSGYKNKRGEYKECLPAYIITIYTRDCIATVERKKLLGGWQSNYAANHATQMRIVNIEYVGKMRSKCVTVDNTSQCYLINDFVVTHNSFSIASMMSHNLILGEDSVAKRRVTSVLTAYTKQYLGQEDGTFSKFTPMIDFCSANTQFPRLMLTRRATDMLWIMGYKNSNGNEMGSLNSVMGLSVKDDEGKIRGKRGFIFFEEIGNYPNFKQTWNNVRDSVKSGNKVYALLYGVGTAGDKESDFTGIRIMLFNPQAYQVYALDNVYSKKGKGVDKFAYFFPAYISREGCMDSNGNSDVVKAVLEILMERYLAKASGDAATLLSVTAQQPITPEEAILRVKSTLFPTVMLSERVRQLDANPHSYDDVYVGTLIDAGGSVVFKATDDYPLREYDEDNTAEGALEIYYMPPKGKIPYNRYIIGVDPVDNDKAESNSLMSIIVFDLYNDEIVAEYTGRKQFAEDGYEMVRLLAVFYNAMIMYESNRKMMYAYFSKKRCLQMLADCPEWIRAKGLVKYDMFGSSVKGVSVNSALISTGIELINDWLKKTVPLEVKEPSGESHIEDVPQLYRIRNRAFLRELISYAPEKNTDRVSAMFQVMFYREQFNILYGGAGYKEQDETPDASDDEFFNRDWNNYLTERKYSSYGTRTIVDDGIIND